MLNVDWERMILSQLESAWTSGGGVTMQYIILMLAIQHHQRNVMGQVPTTKPGHAN